MSEASVLLIVRQRPATYAELESLVGTLREGFQLDPYTTRQRLLGPGLAQLAQGDRESLERMAQLLRRHAHACWVAMPPRPAFASLRLRSLTVGADAVDFHCEGERQVRLERGMAAVGVLADLSGELAGRQVKRLLARNAYLGDGQATLASADQLRTDIRKGLPVFDCYLLDDAGAVTAVFRALPGRFDPQGLGDRADLGATRNLEAVIALVGEYAGTFRLHTDFGLSPLPGCLPQPSRDDPEVLQGNLAALTRYGWLVAGLHEPSGRAAGTAGSPGTLLAAGLAGLAAAAGDGVAREELEGLAATLDDAAAGGPEPAPAAPVPAPLPAPPERPEGRFSLRRALPGIGIILGGVLLVVAGRTDLWRPVLRQFLQSGLLPGDGRRRSGLGGVRLPATEATHRGHPDQPHPFPGHGPGGGPWPGGPPLCPGGADDPQCLRLVSPAQIPARQQQSLVPDQRKRQQPCAVRA